MPENLVAYDIADLPDAEPFVASAGTHLGHVYLKVSSIDRALAFYHTVLGMEIVARYGDEAAFMSAGGYHHHVGMNTWKSLGGSSLPAGTIGLYHAEIVYGSPEELLTVFERLLQFNVHIGWISEHGTHLAIYLYDPDQNGGELYVDRPADQRPCDIHGVIAMSTERLTYDQLRKQIVREVLRTHSSDV